MFRTRFAGMIGNILGHYDNALFGLLAPFIAPLFFDDRDPITALILTYGMMPLGLFTRPIGSLFFGWLGDKLGRKYALSCTLLGMAIVTVGIGCLPLYREVGLWSPISLALARMLQSFFSAGESTGAALFVLENTPPPKRSLISGFYNTSSISGYVLGSALVTWFSMQGWIDHQWRLLFWIGGLSGFFGVILRLQAQETAMPSRPKLNVFQVIRTHKSALLSIIIASGFSFVTYIIPFTLMNGFVPLVTSLSKTEVMQVNTWLLIVDMALLPLFGYLAMKWGKEKVMFWGALWLAIVAVPLFTLLEGASLPLVIFIRFAVVVLGVAFAAPYHAWALERVPSEHRYTILCLGCALGCHLIGTPAASICLWIYKHWGWVFAPGLYLMVFASLAALVIWRSVREKFKLVVTSGDISNYE